MNDILQKAIDCLDIQDVFLCESKCSLLDRLDPKYVDGSNLIAQLKHNVARGEVITLSATEQDEIQVFRVLINFGARWVLEETDNEENVDIRAEIEASFISEYLMKDSPGEDSLNEFALKNAIYHVWPYWREYLMSQCMRMNLPKTVLPAVQFASNAKKIEEEKQELK